VALLLTVFAAVLLWLAFGPFAIYAPSGFVDPWLYTGYFRNFSYLLQHHGFTYYVSRLPWIIPGRIAFSVASPEFASLLLCAAIVTVSGIALYWIVRWHYGPSPAVIAALALITNAYFMSAAGWHYPDGAAIAYAMVALALYLRPRGNPEWNGFLAAGALTLSGFSNMTGGTMILSLLVIPLLRWRHSSRKLVRQVLCALAGVGLTTLLLMAVSKRVFGDARIFKPQFDQALNTMHHPTYLPDMWGTGPAFLFTAVRLFTPAFLLVFVPVLLIAVRKPSTIAWSVYFAFLTCCAAYVLQEFKLHQAILRVPYASSYMMVPVSGLIGVALGELWNHRKAGRMSTMIAAVTLAILTLALPCIYNVWPLAIDSPGLWTRLDSLGAAAIVLAILMRWSWPIWCWPIWSWPILQYAACVLVLIAISWGPGRDAHLTDGLGEKKIFKGSNLSDGPRAEAFRCLTNLQDYVITNVDPQRDVVFWCDRAETAPVTHLFGSAAALFLTDCLDLTKELSTGSGRLFLGNMTVVHLTTHSGRLRDRLPLLESRGVGAENERRRELSYAGNRFSVELQDLTVLAPSH
jgi:hypothetical protein